MDIEQTIVYDTFWKFAYERQNIFIRRLKNAAPPITGDHILSSYRFTNPYRVTDRVTQYLLSEVIYKPPSDPAEVLFRILLFKLFNSINTWKFLVEKIGIPTFSHFDCQKYDDILTAMRDDGRKLYSGAYIMPSGKSSFGSDRKHTNHLKLLELICFDDPINKFGKMNTLQELYMYLLSKPTIGPFLGYQYAIDINYSELTNFEESEFVVPGPGAIGGIHKCFKNVKRGQEASIIEFVYQNQEKEFDIRNLDFQYLHGRKLQLIDIQNIFCEVDKYSRIKHPEIKGTSKRTRIKRKFSPNPEGINYFYPPKWRLDY